MDFDDSPEEAAFRAEARTWLIAHAKENDPSELSGMRSFFDTDHEQADAGRVWQRKLYDGGWAGIMWPKEYGGRGATPMQAMIFEQEEARFDVPRGLYGVALRMVGPSIIAWGTPKQKSRYLDAMLRGDDVWCQLFSEPGAGSDLAGLATRAEADGDEWIVNGQKVWSSGAQHSSRGILLARTDSSQPKHRGISCFLVEMDTPGIEVRPLRQITGGAHFNEVFMTDVRVPKDRLLGPLNDGWRVANTVLGHERSGGSSNSLMGHLRWLVEHFQRSDDPVVRQGVADCYIRGEVLRYLGLRGQTAISQGRAPGAEMSVVKNSFAQLTKRMGELAMAIEGPAAMLRGVDAPVDGAWQQHFLGSPAMRIAAGSDEVQRNIIGERILGLPAEPRTDKDVPFSQLTR